VGAYAVVGAVTAAVLGPFLVLALLGCGVVETAICRPRGAHGQHPLAAQPALAAAVARLATIGGLGAVAWVALKVGALSYGGGFVIVPLMQHDAVQTYG
jgi:chromate transporter